jgi:GntR family transcriptional regulator
MASDRQVDPAAFPQINSGSLAERARVAILSAILEGQFEDRLPAEDVLAKMLNVSRTTIRSALQRLEQEGIVTRRRAIGTTINHHVGRATLALQRLVGFDFLLEEKHGPVRVDTSFDTGTPGPDELDAFALEPGEQAVKVRKLYLADGHPALWIRDVIPADRVRSTPQSEDDIPPSVFEFSKQYCYEQIDHAVVVMVPMVMGGHDTTKLALPEGRPFIRLLETHYSSDATPVAYSIVDVDDRYIRFEVFRREFAK